MKYFVLLLTAAALIAQETDVNGSLNVKGTLRATGPSGVLDMSAAAATRPIREIVSAPTGACSAADGLQVSRTTRLVYGCDAGTNTWTVFGGSTTSDASLLTSGLLDLARLPPVLTGKQASTALALAADPADCSGADYVKGINAAGVPVCSTPAGGGGVTPSTLAGLPGTCTIGDLRYVTDASPPQIYHCYATNTWTTTQASAHSDASLTEVIAGGVKQLRVTPGVFALAGSGSSGYDPLDTSFRMIAEDWMTPRITASPACFGIMCWRVWENGGSNSTTGFALTTGQPYTYMTLTTDGTSGSLRYLTPINAGETPFNTTAWSYAWGSIATGTQFTALMEIDSTTSSVFGYGFDAGTDPVGNSANKIALLYDSSLGAAFRLVTCAASSCTTTVSTVSPSAATKYSLAITKTSGGLTFSVNGETPIAVTATIPTVSMRLAVVSLARAAAVKNVRFYDWRAKVVR